MTKLLMVSAQMGVCAGDGRDNGGVMGFGVRSC